MLEKQGFNKRPNAVTKNDIYNTVERLGCVQIDTINVVERAHYLTLWSRLDTYDKKLLHELAYKDRLLFEHWAHAASYIPLRDYRYYIRSMKNRRDKMEENVKKWGGGDTSILEQVLERIRQEGPLGTKDFEHSRKGPSKGWWDWKPAKIALEALYGAGILLISHRENFQRFYNLAERILPSWVDTSEPTEEERIQFFVLRTMGCLGLIKASNIRKYYLPWSMSLRRTSRQLQVTLNKLVEENRAARFDVEGDTKPYYCLIEDAGRIQEIEEGDFKLNGVRFLTNFDNVLWNRDRVKELFDYEVKLETYIPKEKRKYGYYNLPILKGDHLIGRIVPKMDRKSRTMIIHSVWHEPWFKPDETFENAFNEAMESFARFNGADNVEIREEKPRIG